MNPCLIRYLFESGASCLSDMTKSKLEDTLLHVFAIVSLYSNKKDSKIMMLIKIIVMRIVIMMT